MIVLIAQKKIFEVLKQIKNFERVEVYKAMELRALEQIKCALL